MKLRKLAGKEVKIEFNLIHRDWKLLAVALEKSIASDIWLRGFNGVGAGSGEGQRGAQKRKWALLEAPLDTRARRSAHQAKPARHRHVPAHGSGRPHGRRPPPVAVGRRRSPPVVAERRSVSLSAARDSPTGSCFSWVSAVVGNRKPPTTGERKARDPHIGVGFRSFITFSSNTFLVWNECQRVLPAQKKIKSRVGNVIIV